MSYVYALTGLMLGLMNMKIVKHIVRFSYINLVLIKHLLSIHKPRAIRIREALEQLGPIFVKFGQLLSTRLDLLPDDISKELVKLQDSVPPFSSVHAKKMVEDAFNCKIEELFAEFELQPIASASISQVHAATMHSGQRVVVKVLRPKVKKQITRDLDLLYIIAKIAPLFWSDLRRVKPKCVVLEIRKSMFDELDLVREAANASQLRRNFANSNLLYVPKIYWSHTKQNVLTIERLEGLQISNIAGLRANNTDLKLLAERGVEIFFTQVFRDCFFHADMHPGNVWVSKQDPQNPQYLALDFGIIGTLNPADQHYLAENFLAFFKRDYRRVAQLHVESGWVPKTTRVDEFEAAIRAVCEPIFAKPLNEISFGKTLLRLFQTAKRFDMEIQPQLVLLQKTLISVEGLGRQLYPELDLWTTAKPFLERWMQKRIGKNMVIRKLKNFAPFWLEKLPELPNLLYNNYQMISANNSTAQTANRPSVWYYFALGAVSAVMVTLLILRIMHI